MGTVTTTTLWISGAPGTGKTTTGWRVFELLTAGGGNAAYVDIDQLGLLGPYDRLAGSAPHAVKAENARRLIRAWSARGLRQMVVSGVVDPNLGAPRLGAGTGADIELEHVRLRCDWAELRRRYLARGSTADVLADLEQLARRLDRTSADTVDTTSRDVEDVAQELLVRHTSMRPGPWTPAPSARAAPLPTTLVYGAPAVGKSSVGWELVRRRWAAGRATGYIDVGQLGFVGPDYEPGVHAAGYAALTAGYERAGAEDLVVVARDPELDTDAHEDEALTRVLLDASDRALSARVARRSHDNTGRLPGDDLLGADPARQRAIAAGAHRAAAHLRRHRDGCRLTIDTTHSEPSAVVDRIEHAIDGPLGSD